MSEEVDLKRENSEQELYKPPPEKSLDEILNADKNDESLQLYKEKLLGNAAKDVIIVDQNNPKRVIVKRMALVVEGRPDMVIDLEGDALDNIKSNTFTIKEGIKYRIKIDFYVQREIVTGLKYVQKILRKGIQVETMSQMIGSYAPNQSIQTFLSPLEEMPSGMLFRDKYTVKSKFTDDDKNEHLKFEWSFEIKKDPAGW